MAVDPQSPDYVMAVIGTGTMGRGIAQVFAYAGYEVTIVDFKERLPAQATKLLEEAKKRDHRVVGKKLNLFHVDDMVGQGLVLWTPNGAVVRQELQNFISQELKRQQYRQVFTPHIGKLDLYRTSGHYPYYQKSQYPPLIKPDQLV